MKISVFIVTGAQAFANRGHVQREWICGNRNPQPCDFLEWFVDNWWSPAVESFNFVSKKWEELTDTVKSVSTHWVSRDRIEMNGIPMNLVSWHSMSFDSGCIKNYSCQNPPNSLHILKTVKLGPISMEPRIRFLTSQNSEFKR